MNTRAKYNVVVKKKKKTFKIIKAGSYIPEKPGSRFFFFLLRRSVISTSSAVS